MPSRRPHGESTGPQSPDNNAIIDKIYAIACDPQLYEDLIDAWSQKLSEASAGEIETSEILRAHAARATALLERLSPIDARSDMEKLVGDLQRPALACIENGKIVYANKALAASLQARSPPSINDLDLSESSVRTLSQHLRDRGGSRHLLLQLETRVGHPISVSLSHAGSAVGETTFLVVFYDFIWNSMLENVLSESFGLTASERAVVQGFAGGLSMAQIARQRGRSEETVRTQLKTIMAKTGTRSQLELLRLLFGFTALSEHAASGNAQEPVEGLRPAERRKLAGMTGFITRSGRRYDVHISGATSRHLCLHLHSSMGLYLLSDRARRLAAERGLQLWSVLRPGYGSSGPLPAQADYNDAIAADLVELIERSDTDAVSLLVEGVSFRIGVELVRRLGSRCRSISVASPVMRVSAASLDGHDQKWHRIVFQTAVRSPILLPFFIRAGFAYARAVGPFRFMEEIYNKSPFDLEALEDPAVVSLLQAASRVSLSEGAQTHQAFADGLLLAVGDWADEIATVTCPVVIYYGKGDRTFRKHHAEQVRLLNPAITDVEFDDAGHLAILTHGHRIIADIAARDRT